LNLEYDDLKEKFVEHSDENTRKIQINFPDESTETLYLVDKNILEMLDASLKVLEVKKGEGDTYTAKVAGDFLFHGVTKPLTVDATVKYLPGKLKARGGVEKDGDIVQVYSKFSVNRLDFDVAPDLSTDLIGNKIDIDLAVTGIAVR
jgi:3D (Asp-Asp-Asp) domain-containing protein